MTSIDINLILDASGSMQRLVSDTVGGVNHFIDRQRDESGDAYVTLTTFDDRSVQRYFARRIADVPMLTKESYYDGHGGRTALIDAVGKAIADYESLPIRADKAMFVIATDGEENASVECTIEQLRESIKTLQARGYAFVFLGANDAQWQAASFGVNAQTTGAYRATPAGTRAMYANLARNTSAIRASVGSAGDAASELSWNTDDEGGARPRTG